MRFPTTPLQRYGMAALVIGATLLVRALMTPLWETTAPFALFMFATIIAAWCAGTGPALLTGAAGFAARLYFDSPGHGSLLPITWEEAVRLTLFAGFVGGAVVVVDRMKSDRRELQLRIAEARAEIEERRRLEEVLRAARAQAEEATRLKDEFLAMVSHELRTPLNAILGWASLLGGGTLSGPRASHAVDVIQRNARLQAQLVTDLIDVARSLTGRLHLDAGVVDMGPLAVDAAEQVRAAFHQKGVTLTVDVPPAPMLVWGDAGRLRQIVMNLLGNGLKFTPGGGRVALLLSTRGTYAELVVSDTGAGIPPDFLPHVFDRFTQADTGSTRHHGGLGLGLALVRQLVELHRGQIEASSDGVACGALFTVRLPLHAGKTDPDDEPPRARGMFTPDGQSVSGRAVSSPRASARET
jgi:signal transduction histidine kinase